jgi:hypothetical protein
MLTDKPTKLALFIAIPTLAFVATLVVTLRSAGGPDVRAAPPAPVLPAHPGPPAEIAMPEPGLPAPAIPDTLPAETRPAAPPSTALAPVSNTDPAAGGMPLRLFVGPKRGNAPGIATLMNLSGETLQVRITAVNAKTLMRSTADVELLQHQRKNLTAEGLIVEQGDEVTLQSPPYPDQVIRAQ